MEAINKNNLLESLRESRKDFRPKIMKYWRQPGSLKRRYCLGGAHSVNDFRGRDRNLLWRLITGCVESVSWLGFVGNSLVQRTSVDVIHVLREIMGTQLNSTWSLIISHVCCSASALFLLFQPERKQKQNIAMHSRYFASNVLINISYNFELSGTWKLIISWKSLRRCEN